MGRPLAKLSVVGVLVAIAVVLVIELPVGRAMTVSGHVDCVSGSSIVGIWVVAGSGGSGWAVWTPQEGRPSNAVYKHRLPLGGKYSLHVGCGGTPANWATSNKSEYVEGSVRDFVCIDTPDHPQFLECRAP